MFEVSPISGTFGAEIHGVDASATITPEVIAKLWETFFDYKLLVFRDQLAVGPREHLAFARNFGSPEIHPYLTHVSDVPEVSIHESFGTGDYGKQGDNRELKTPSGIHETWHTDGSTRTITS